MSPRRVVLVFDERASRRVLGPAERAIRSRWHLVLLSLGPRVSPRQQALVGQILGWAADSQIEFDAIHVLNVGQLARYVEPEDSVLTFASFPRRRRIRRALLTAETQRLVD